MTDLEAGTQIEMEHAESITKILKDLGVAHDDKIIRLVAEQIARDHLIEDQDYYKKLIKAGL